MWVSIALILVSILYSAYMARKNQPHAAIFEDGDFPTADEGTPQYVVFGDCWSADWCVIAWGNQRNRKVKKGGFLSKHTVGYRYFASLQMGLGRGPLNAITAIRVGDKVAWTGSAEGNAAINIDKFDLFGGDEGQGGIVGTAQVLMGERTQQAPDLLQKLLGGATTGCRGVATVLFDGMLCAMSKSPQPWVFRHWRTTQGWDRDPWYPEKALILLRNDLADLSDYPADQRDAMRNIHAINGAHMLVEVATSHDWGRGMDLSELDLDSYKAAADQLYAEGLGLCLRYTRGGSLVDFVQQVLDHISGAQFVSLSTGLLTLRLIRADYNVADLPTFGYDSGLLAIEDMETSTDEEVNVVIGTYSDPVKREQRQVRARNTGAVQATGSNVVMTRDYPGLPTWQLAQRAVERDLRVKTGGAKNYKVTLDRRGRWIEPAGLMVIHAPEEGLDQLVLRVAKIERGKITDGKIVITCAVDVFGLGALRLSNPPGSVYIPPATDAQPAIAQSAWELSYRDLAHSLSLADLAALPARSGYVGAVGKRPTSSTSDFALAVSTANATYNEVAEVECTPYARIAADMARSDQAITIHLVGETDLDALNVGQALLIDSEIVRLDAIDLQTHLCTIARGCADTVPAAHPAGTVVWGYEAGLGVDPTLRFFGDTVNLKLLTRTSSDKLDPILATSMSVTLADRAARPYPPACLRINGLGYPDQLYGSLAATWAHRDRTQQSGTLVASDAGSIGPESGTNYTTNWYLDGALVRNQSGISSAGDVYSPPPGSGGKTVRVEVESLRDTHESWQKLQHTFLYRAQLVTEEGDRIVSEAGGVFILE
ncbi:hypothetical protein [Xanthomonas albilineans]|uniref:hypothetical protein n=1 Tax=Xanthomonas albilineans TaxID=29447 RepID=UPI0027D986EC|nr:hypothetical protein [Xanthomonas albilineans]